MQKVFDRVIKQAAKEYQPRQRTLAMLILSPLFLVFIPLAYYFLGRSIDSWLGIPAVLFPPINAILGCLVILGSLLFAFWSIYVQFTLGRGTPVPLMATQKLIIQPPYSYCRNPMALGAIGLYAGEAIVLGSVGILIIVLIGAGLLLTYIKRIEEKEMEVRFGQEYLDYRKQTPFLFPRFRK